jgi:hypothetical protein
MNEQDKEAFEKWWMDGFKGMPDKDIIKYKNVGKQSAMNGWQAACEYKKAKFDAYVSRDEMVKEIKSKLKIATDTLLTLKQINKWDAEVSRLLDSAIESVRGEK